MSWLRKLFGVPHTDIWKQVSAEIGGRFIEGSFFKGESRIEVTVRNWTITLDTFTVSTGKSSATYTRMRARFANQDGFRFTIHRRGVFTGMGKLFGVQDVEVGGPKYEQLEPLFGLRSYLDKEIIETGSPEFDRDFVIKGNDESKLKILFKDLKIRELIEAHPSFFMQVKGIGGWFGRKKYKGIDELYFQVLGVIKDPDLLKGLFELYAEILKSLHAMGTAREDAPSER